MTLVQYIYTTTNRDWMTPEKGVRLSVRSVDICERLSMTGRVFSTRSHALSIVEGPAAVIAEYYAAVDTQPHVDTLLLQSVRDIETREFDDYSVWLDIDHAFPAHPQVHPMTLLSQTTALPAVPSVRLRVMIDAFFQKGRLVS